MSMRLLMQYLSKIIILLFSLVFFCNNINIDIKLNDSTKNKDHIEKSICSKFLLNIDEIETEEIKIFSDIFFQENNFIFNQFCFSLNPSKYFFNAHSGHKVSLNILYCQLKYHL